MKMKVVCKYMMILATLVGTATAALYKSYKWEDMCIDQTREWDEQFIDSKGKIPKKFYWRDDCYLDEDAKPYYICPYKGCKNEFYVHLNSRCANCFQNVHEEPQANDPEKDSYDIRICYDVRGAQPDFVDENGWFPCYYEQEKFYWRNHGLYNDHKYSKQPAFDCPNRKCKRKDIPLNDGCQCECSWSPKDVWQCQICREISQIDLDKCGWCQRRKHTPPPEWMNPLLGESAEPVGERWNCRFCGKTDIHWLSDHCPVCRKNENDPGDEKSSETEPSEQWQCQVCTFKNNACAKQCVMCDSPRGQSYDQHVAQHNR